MNQKNIYIVVASAIMILFCLVYQGTYSFFVTSLDDERGEDISSSMSAAILKDLVLVGNGEGVTGDSVGETLWIPGDSAQYHFNITNGSSVQMCFKLYWHDVTNGWSRKEDLVYKLEKNGEEKALVSDTQFPSSDTENAEIGVFSLPATTTGNYTLTITYKETDDSQNVDMKKKFAGTISGVPSDCSYLTQSEP